MSTNMTKGTTINDLGRGENKLRKIGGPSLGKKIRVTLQEQPPPPQGKKSGLSLPRKKVGLILCENILLRGLPEEKCLYGRGFSG